MGHKYDVKNKEKLDNPKRRKMLPPGETLEKLGLEKDMVMMDVGCGIGYFSLPAGKIVGEGGKVFALDISGEMLEEVEKKKEEEKVGNIETTLVGENDFSLPKGSVDFAFVCFVLHEAKDQEKFIYEAASILKEGGKMAIIEWEKEASPMGPPVDHRIDKRDVEVLLKKQGFGEIEFGKITENLYSIVGIK